MFISLMYYSLTTNKTIMMTLHLLKKVTILAMAMFTGANSLLAQTITT